MNKEFIPLIMQNMAMLHWMTSRIKHDPEMFGYPRSQLRVVAQLYMIGRRTLKDISQSTEISSSNLSVMLKDLETDGIVLREPDDNDRRLVWYALTADGKKLGAKIVAEAQNRISDLFNDISAADEKKLTDALIKMNEVLTKVKNSKE